VIDELNASNRCWKVPNWKSLSLTQSKKRGMFNCFSAPLVPQAVDTMIKRDRLLTSFEILLQFVYSKGCQAALANKCKYTVLKILFYFAKLSSLSINSMLPRFGLVKRVLSFLRAQQKQCCDMLRSNVAIVWPGLFVTCNLSCKFSLYFWHKTYAKQKKSCRVALDMKAANQSRWIRFLPLSLDNMLLVRER